MDFVTFEISKKLKEKGFPQHWSDQHYILENEYEDDFFEVGAKYPVDVIYDYIPTIAAPTISQVLKWLRKEKKIYVSVEVEREDWFEYKIVQTTKNTRCNSTRVYETYDNAMIEGIEYVLYNLI